MAYATLTELRAYIKATSTSDNDLLTDLLARAQALIDHHTGRTFEASGDTTRYFRVADARGRELRLDADLCQITSVTNGDGNTVASTQYTVEPRNTTPWHTIRLKSASAVYWTYSTDAEDDEIAIAGRWAYSLVAPADISQATIRWAAYLYRQKDASVFDVTATPELGVLTIPQGIPQDVRVMLAPYRRRTL